MEKDIAEEVEFLPNGSESPDEARDDGSIAAT